MASGWIHPCFVRWKHTFANARAAAAVRRARRSAKAAVHLSMHGRVDIGVTGRAGRDGKIGDRSPHDQRHSCGAWKGSSGRVQCLRGSLTPLHRAEVGRPSPRCTVANLGCSEHLLHFVVVKHRWPWPSPGQTGTDPGTHRPDAGWHLLRAGMAMLDIGGRMRLGQWQYRHCSGSSRHPIVSGRVSPRSRPPEPQGLGTRTHPGVHVVARLARW